jgi:hypothetical protein
MGMFDTVHFEMDCPNCGAKVINFQSKDDICNLELIEPDGLMNFYSSCDKCKTWIDFVRPRPDQRPLREKMLTKAEVEAMGFVMRVQNPTYDSDAPPK